MRKLVKWILFCAIFINMSIPVYASEEGNRLEEIIYSAPDIAIGWKWENDKWYYYDESGNMTSGWQQVHGIWYYMDDSGVMQTDWQEIDGEWYYFNSEGALIVNEWMEAPEGSNIWYYCQEAGQC